jgi:hypothetical protein
MRYQTLEQYSLGREEDLELVKKMRRETSMEIERIAAEQKAFAQAKDFVQAKLASQEIKPLQSLTKALTIVIDNHFGQLKNLKDYVPYDLYPADLAEEFDSIFYKIYLNYFE